MIDRMGDLVLLRHGQTEWSLAGKHTGRTDIPLTTHGAASAASLGPMLEKRQVAAVFTSPASRAVKTAELPLLPQVQGMYNDVLQPQLIGSRLAPWVMRIGQHLPGLGGFGPQDIPVKAGVKKA